MKILVIGSGGREHALAWKLKESKRTEKLYAIPGNPGMAAIAECVPQISPTDNTAVVAFAKEKGIPFLAYQPEDEYVPAFEHFYQRVSGDTAED